PAAHDASPTRWLSTPRRRQSVPNATSKTRSRRSENASPSRSQNPSRDVHAVSRRPDHLQPDCVYDTVKLSGFSLCLLWRDISEGGGKPLTIVVSFDAGEPDLIGPFDAKLRSSWLVAAWALQRYP